MSNTIDQIGLKNTFNISICPWRDKSPDQITRENKENPYLPLRKGFEFGYTAEDIFENPTEALKTIFHEKWVNELVCDKTGVKSNEIFQKLLENGYSKEQAVGIVNQAYRNGFRSKDWAEFNKSKGKTASCLMNTTIGLGVLSKVLDHESVPKTIRTCVDVAHGVSLGARTYNQGSIYNRPDDDAAKNRFEAEYYGATVTGALADAAMTVETKIRFWAEPLAELLPEPYKGIAKTILPVFSGSWWRARMASAINHEFLTDLLRYIVHKPLSLFGVKKSIEVTDQIKERKNLEWSYVKERHYKNAGLTDKNDQKLSKLIPRLFKLIKLSFTSKDTTIKKDSTIKVANTIAPALGIWGLFAATLGSVVKSVLRMKDVENKYINFLSSSSILSQQIIYLFKLIVPIRSEAEELNKQLNTPGLIKTYTQKEILEREGLVNKKKRLASLGFGCFLINTLNTFLKLKDFDNSFLKKTIEVIDELSGDLIQKFFSHRRHLKGYEFRVMNPEYYDDNQEENLAVSAN